MKKTFLILLTLVSMATLAQKSDDKGSKKSKIDTELNQDATELALKMCACIEGIVKQYHPSLQDLMKDMIETGEEEAQAKFAEKLLGMSDNEQAKVMADIERMQKFETEMGEKCGNNLEEEYSKYDGNKEFEDKMIEHLKTLPECSLTYRIMSLGRKK